MSIQPRAFAILLNKVIDLIFSTWQNLINNVMFLILTCFYRILIFMYVFGNFFQKGHCKDSSKKRAHWQKTLRGGGGGWRTPLPPCSGEPERWALLLAKWKCHHKGFPSEHARSYGFYSVWASLTSFKLLRILNFLYENYCPYLTSRSKCRGSVSHGDIKFWVSGNANTGRHCLLL